jgi:hypothetical protein
MHISFILDWWLVLPLLITIILIAGGLWMDIPDILDMEGTIVALLIAAPCWAAILYGRYEPWLVLPIIYTVYALGVAYSDRKDMGREGLKFLATALIFVWTLLIYGRLTA